MLSKKYKLSDTINPGEVNIVAKRSDAPESAVSRSRRYLMGTPDISVMVTRQYESYSNVLKFIIAKFWYGVKIKNPIFLLNGMPVAGETLEWLPVIWIERIDVCEYRGFSCTVRTPISSEEPVYGANRFCLFGYSDGARQLF